MKKYLLVVCTLIFLLLPLLGSTSITLVPTKNEYHLNHKDSLEISEIDTLFYSLSSHNNTFYSSSLSFKFLRKKENYTVSIGDIRSDIRIMMLSGDIYTSTRSLFSSNDLLTLQLTQSSTTSIAYSFHLTEVSFHSFLISHLGEQNTYLSGGVLFDSPPISSGLSFLSSIKRDDKEEPLLMFNQLPLIKGWNSYVVLKKDDISLFTLYTLNLRLLITSSFPLNQQQSTAYIFHATIEDTHKELIFRSTYHPQYAHRWDEVNGKRETITSSVEYTYYHEWFDLSYSYVNEIFEKGLFAYNVAPSKSTHLFSVKGTSWLLSYRTKGEVNEKNTRKEEKRVRLSYSLSFISLTSTLTLRNSLYLFHNKITFDKEYYSITVELDYKKRLSYTLSFDKANIPFDVSVRLTSKQGATFSFTIDQ